MFLQLMKSKPCFDFNLLFFLVCVFFAGLIDIINCFIFRQLSKMIKSKLTYLHQTKYGRQKKILRSMKLVLDGIVKWHILSGILTGIARAIIAYDEVYWRICQALYPSQNTFRKGGNLEGWHTDCKLVGIDLLSYIFFQIKLIMIVLTIFFRLRTKHNFGWFIVERKFSEQSYSFQFEKLRGMWLFSKFPFDYEPNEIVFGSQSKENFFRLWKKKIVFLSIWNETKTQFSECSLRASPSAQNLFQGSDWHFLVTGKFLLRKFHLGKFHLENSSYGKKTM